jgi:hypothetical protein
MNAHKLVFALLILLTGTATSSADPRQDFSNCIDVKTKAAMASRPPVAEFVQMMKTVCTSEEMIYVTELSMASLTHLDVIKELNLSHQKRSEAFAVEERRATNEFYAKWYAATARQ